MEARFVTKINAGLSTRLKESIGLKIKRKSGLKQGGFALRIVRSAGAVRIGVAAFARAGLLLAASGCLATRSWVQDQLRPITGQQQRMETQLNSLYLERRLVLDSSGGPTFATGSAALSGNAKREIDQFLGDLEGPTGSWSTTAERVFMFAGYADSVGHEDYNYELGLRRARCCRISRRQEGPRPDPVSGGLLRCELAGRRQPHTEWSAQESAGRDSRLPRKDRHRRLVRHTTSDGRRLSGEGAVRLSRGISQGPYARSQIACALFNRFSKENEPP
jgi:hypothetical protein